MEKNYYLKKLCEDKENIKFLKNFITKECYDGDAARYSIKYHSKFKYDKKTETLTITVDARKFGHGIRYFCFSDSHCINLNSGVIWPGFSHSNVIESKDGNALVHSYFWKDVPEFLVWQYNIFMAKKFGKEYMNDALKYFGADDTNFILSKEDIERLKNPRDFVDLLNDAKYFYYRQSFLLKKSFPYVARRKIEGINENNKQQVEKQDEQEL